MAIITAQAKKAIESQKVYKLEHIINTEIVAVVTLKPQVDGKIVVSVFLMTQNPRQRIQEVNAMQGTAIGMATVETTLQNLCVSIYKKYKDTMSPSTVTRQRGTSVEFVARVDAIPNVRNHKNFDPYVKKGWGENTADSAVTYYANTFGKFYEKYGEDADAEDFEEFRASEVDRIYAEQYIRKDVNVEVIQRRRDRIYNSLNTRFASAAAVQKFLLKNHPEGKFPITPIPVSIRTTARSAERVKAISMEQYIKLVAILQQLCLADVPYGFAVLLEVVCGARIGESCAPLIGEFELKPDHGRYYICHQVNQKGERTDVLKNEYSYRYVFFGNFLIDMIKLRVSQLEALGYTHEEIGEMPLAALHKTPRKFLDKNKASAFLRALLTLVGCDERWLEAQAAQMYAAAAAAGNSEDLEVCAHTLRSTIATFACNGGVEAEAVDAFLGHKNDVNRKKDYASWAVAQALSSKLERCIYLGSLCETTNPAYAPVMANEGQRYVLEGNLKYCFETKQDIYATFDLQNLHPGSVLKIRMPKQKGEELFWVRTVPNDMAKIGTVAILQPLSDEDEVEKWIAEAREIDLDALILKYGETI